MQSEVKIIKRQINGGRGPKREQELVVEMSVDSQRSYQNEAEEFLSEEDVSVLRH
jgi:hypothetical protein